MSGSKINSMAKELKNGRMEQSMRDNTKMERSMAKVVSHLRTVALTPDLSVIMRYQALVNILGRTEKCTKANGKETKCMAKES